MAQLELPPFVVWRDGRPRWVPGPRERELGFKGQDLRHAGGAWYTVEEVVAWGGARHAEVLARRKAPAPAPSTPAAHRGTIADLLDDWYRSISTVNPERSRRRRKPLTPDTLRTYAAAIKAICYQPETRAETRAREAKGREPVPERFALTPVHGRNGEMVIGPEELVAFHEYIEEKRGLNTAALVIAVLSCAFKWGRLAPTWKIRENPCRDLDLPRPEGRIVIYSEHEIRHLIATADAMQRWSIGDAVMLGLFTAQRQRDRLLFEEELIDGRRVFRQSKTGAVVPILDSPMLATRLAAARKRVTELKLRLGTRPTTIVVDEATGHPYAQSSYRFDFGTVRREAAKTCPSLFDKETGTFKRDQDLRDTAITWLARADCTIPQICAISGHSPQSVQLIMKHYLGATRELGDSAVTKLNTWMVREGISL